MLEYNKLLEERSLNSTWAGFHNDNNIAEVEQDFSSALDNLALSVFPDKDFITPLISSIKTSIYYNKTLEDTNASLIHNGTGNRGRATQTFEEKEEIRSKNVFQNWIQGDIAGHMGTRSYTYTKEIL